MKNLANKYNLFQFELSFVRWHFIVAFSSHIHRKRVFIFKRISNLMIDWFIFQFVVKIGFWITSSASTKKNIHKWIGTTTTEMKMIKYETSFSSKHRDWKCYVNSIRAHLCSKRKRRRNCVEIRLDIIFVSSWRIGAAVCVCALIYLKVFYSLKAYDFFLVITFWCKLQKPSV